MVRDSNLNNYITPAFVNSFLFLLEEGSEKDKFAFNRIVDSFSKLMD